MKKHRKHIFLLLLLVLIAGAILWGRFRIVRGVSRYLRTEYPDLDFVVHRVTPTIIPPGANVRVRDRSSGVTFDTYLRYQTAAAKSTGSSVADPDARQILTDLQAEVRRFSFTAPRYTDNYRASLTRTITALELEPLLKHPDFSGAIGGWTLSVQGADPLRPVPESSTAQLIVRWNTSVPDEERFVEYCLRFEQALQELQVEALAGCTFQSQALPLDPAAFERIGSAAKTWKEVYTRLPETTTVPLTTTSINPQEMSPEDWQALVDTEETTVEIIGVSSGYTAEWFYYTLTLNESFRPYAESDLKNGLRLIELNEREKLVFEQSLRLSE